MWKEKYDEWLKRPKCKHQFGCLATLERGVL